MADPLERLKEEHRRIDRRICLARSSPKEEDWKSLRVMEAIIRFAEGDDRAIEKFYSEMKNSELEGW